MAIANTKKLAHKETNPMLLLPNEVIVNIAGYLEPNELPPLFSVSRTFFANFQDDMIWREHTAKALNLPTSRLSEFANRYGIANQSLLGNYSCFYNMFLNLKKVKRITLPQTKKASDAYLLLLSGHTEEIIPLLAVHELLTYLCLAIETNHIKLAKMLIHQLYFELEPSQFYQKVVILIWDKWHGKLFSYILDPSNGFNIQLDNEDFNDRLVRNFFFTAFYLNTVTFRPSEFTLYKAIENGNLTVVKFLLNPINRFNIMLSENHGSASQLQEHAIISENIEMVRYLFIEPGYAYAPSHKPGYYHLVPAEQGSNNKLQLSKHNYYATSNEMLQLLNQLGLPAYQLEMDDNAPDLTKAISMNDKDLITRFFDAIDIGESTFPLSHRSEAVLAAIRKGNVFAMEKILNYVKHNDPDTVEDVINRAMFLVALDYGHDEMIALFLREDPQLAISHQDPTMQHVYLCHVSASGNFALFKKMQQETQLAIDESILSPAVIQGHYDLSAYLLASNRHLCITDEVFFDVCQTSDMPMIHLLLSHLAENHADALKTNFNLVKILAQLVMMPIDFRNIFYDLIDPRHSYQFSLQDVELDENTKASLTHYNVNLISSQIWLDNFCARLQENIFDVDALYQAYACHKANFHRKIEHMLMHTEKYHLTKTLVEDLIKEPIVIENPRPAAMDCIAFYAAVNQNHKYRRT